MRIHARGFYFTLLYYYSFFATFFLFALGENEYLLLVNGNTLGENDYLLRILHSLAWYALSIKKRQPKRLPSLIYFIIHFDLLPVLRPRPAVLLASLYKSFQRVVLLEVHQAPIF